MVNGYGVKPKQKCRILTKAEMSYFKEQRTLPVFVFGQDRSFLSMGVSVSVFPDPTSCAAWAIVYVLSLGEQRSPGTSNAGRYAESSLIRLSALPRLPSWLGYCL